MSARTGPCALTWSERVSQAGWEIYPVAPLSIIRRHGQPVDRGDVVGLEETTGDPLVLISSGTVVRVAKVGGWSSFYHDAAGDSIQFEMQDGRWFVVDTMSVEGIERDPSGMLWWKVAVAAIVVPIGHPLATAGGPALVADIDQLARAEDDGADAT